MQRRASAYRGVRPLVLSKLSRGICFGQAPCHIYRRLEILRPALPHLPYCARGQEFGVGAVCVWGETLRLRRLHVKSSTPRQITMPKRECES